MNIQEMIDEIFAENGSLSQVMAVQPDVLEQYRGKLPDILLEIWRQKGVGSWRNGLYRLCVPSDFDGLLSQIFHADQDFSHKDCHVIAYSAFGELKVWSERHWFVNISLSTSMMDCTTLIDPQKKRNPNTPVISRFFGVAKDDTLDAHDDAGKPLFARARKLLGDLEPGECYGFFPALAMGGAPTLKNLKRTPALPHFTFLAQLQPFTLMDYLARPIKAVRQIG